MTEFNAEYSLEKTAAIAAFAKEAGWTYGDSQSNYPCDDGVISCDRLLARSDADANAQLGLNMPAQQAGGYTVLTMESYYDSTGLFDKITDPHTLRRGDRVLMRVKGQDDPTADWHTFQIVDFRATNDFDKYDEGSQSRIDGGGYYTNCSLSEWTDKEFYAAWRLKTDNGGYGLEYNTALISEHNTYANNTPEYIVIHNTDNYTEGANAQRHAMAQYNGDFTDMSAHWYVDDGNTAYQAAQYDMGCWHVGKDYSGGTAVYHGICNNRNSIGIEGCVQAGYDYASMFQHMVELTKHVMAQTGIDADHVIRHYDVCGKHCPSAIIEHGDWERFKQLIRGENPQITGTQASNIISTARAAYNGDADAQEAVIETLGTAAQMAWSTYGFLPSVLIAQCIQESGWLSFADEAQTDGHGHTGLTPASNNCLGMNKVLNGWIGDVWGGKYGYYWVPQEHNGVTSYGIETMREYADLEHCLADFAGFRTSQHPCIIGNTDYNSVIDNGLCGGDGGTAYATGSQYGPHLKARIQQYNLTRFDMLGKERKMVSLQIKTCSKGDHDNSVLQLQRHLIGCGYDLGSAGADGDYGDKTAEAVSAYEQYIWDAYGTNIGSTDADGNFCTDGMAGEKVMQSLFGI